MRTSPADLAGNALDAAPDAIIIIDAVGSIKYANRRVAALFGYTHDELLGQSIESLIPERFDNIRDSYMRPMESAIALVGRRRDGTECALEISLSPIDDGDRTLVVATIRDVTERKRLEAEREGTERGYRAIVQEQTEAICRYLSDGTLVFANDAFCRLVGKPSQELMGHAWKPFTMPTDRPQIERELNRLSPQHPVVTIETRIVSTDGETRWGQFVNRGFFDDAGQLIETLSVGRDITERKLLDERLREAAQTNEDLYNSAPCGYHSLDERGIYLKINDTELAWVGCKRDDVIGKMSPADFYTEEGRQRFQTLFPTFLRIGRVTGMEFELISRTGQHRHVIVSKTVATDASGRFLMSRGITFDITERRQLEEALERASDSAVEANDVKSRFLAAASHDLRQPLQTIWSVHAALSRMVKNADVVPQLALLEEAVRNMDQMLSSLIDINRLEKGAIQPVIRDFPLEDILPRLRSEYAYAASSKALILTIDNSGEYARSDPMLLPVIIRNLIGNAIKYTQRGTIHLRVRPEGSQLFIDIIDTGPGIAQVHLQGLFDAFYQIDNPNRDQRHGVGLGLSIVQTICRLLDHAVTIESQIGRGTTFTVQVPRGVAVDNAGERVQTPLAVTAAPAGNVTVLHIEDDPGVARSMALLLRLEGYEVVNAATRDEALQQVQEHGVRPDLILCDYNLPMGFTGDEIVAELAIALGLKPPTIILTGDIADTHVKKAKLVADLIFPKPVDIRVLLDGISALLAQRAAAVEPPDGTDGNTSDGTLASRCDPFFAELLGPSHLRMLEKHPHAVYGVLVDLAFAYMNPAWFAFSSHNDGDRAIPSAWPIGRSSLDAVPECLKAWYTALFTAPLASQEEHPKEYEYECSSADYYRRFVMKIFPLMRADKRGFLIVNSLRFEVPHVRSDRLAQPPDDEAYTDPAGLIHQCVNCRRVQSAVDPLNWHWVPEWVRRAQSNVRDFLCPKCQAQFYPAPFPSPPERQPSWAMGQ